MKPLTCCLLAILYVLVLSAVAGAIAHKAKWERDRGTLAYPPQQQEDIPKPSHTLLPYRYDDNIMEEYR